MCALGLHLSPMGPALAVLLLFLVVVSAQQQRRVTQLPPNNFYAPDVDTTSPVPLPRVPPSPYHMSVDNCPQQDGIPYAVGGFPGTPFLQTPFSTIYRQPPHLQPTTVVCRTGDPSPAHCMRAYDMEMTAIKLRPWDATIPACRALPPTECMAYNGVVPGPTITATV